MNSWFENEYDEDAYFKNHMQWLDHMRQIEKKPDENGKVVLTNFDNDKIEIYRKSIKLYESVDYEKSQECQFEIKENVAHDVYGKTINKEDDPSHSSLWHKPGGKFGADRGDFWQVYDEVLAKYEKDYLRQEKLKRILFDKNN
ncbi:MAG: hypothetical protein M0R46_11655 [Candidatus Muirbacterium halophilum]|nr:hypothetical protein [Candidatus Muirbacterium halophilum]